MVTGNQDSSGAESAPMGTGLAGPGAAPATDASAAQTPAADAFDSAGRADFIRQRLKDWDTAPYEDRQTTRQLLYDSGYDVGVPKITDRNGRMVPHPHLPMLNGERNPAQEEPTKKAMQQYLDNELARPGINADRYTAIHDPEKILNDPDRPWFDMPTEKVLAKLDPRLQALARLHFEAMHDAGLRTSMNDEQGYRTYEKQHEKFLQRPVVTKADAGYSNHNFGLAYDVNQLDEHRQLIKDGSDPAYAKAGKLGEQSGLEWGGDWKTFKDRPHYQFTRNAEMKDLRARHNQGLDPLPQTD